MHLLQRAARTPHLPPSTPLASSSSSARYASSYQSQRPRSRLDPALTQQRPPRPSDAPRRPVEHDKAAAGGGMRESMARRRAWLDREARRDAPASATANEDASDASGEPEQIMIDDVESAFSYDTPATSMQGLADKFASPPLTPGLAASVTDFLGHDARPTPIQRLSLAHLVGDTSSEHTHALLAAETGSGKSLAYLLPLLQDLKRTEHASSAKGPRALVLAPTHELARQLTGFAKALVHHDKLRVQTASRANVQGARTAAGMSAAFGADAGGAGEFRVTPGGAGGRGVDVLLGTTRKLLEMARGRGWNRKDDGGEGVRRRKGEPRAEISLKDVEWVVVDEADVLFNQDFIAETEMLLADIARARGASTPATGPARYPFNLVLSSATIPVALHTHLSARLPHLRRLVSPSVHRLPPKLSVEFAPLSASGNRHADVERRLRETWADDAHAGRPRSRVVVFANGRGTVDALGAHLDAKGVPNVAVTGAGGAGRVFGSNKHLAGFLSTQKEKKLAAVAEGTEGASAVEEDSGPRVLVSTALLARGMDFAPDVRTVFLLDAPATAADFLHRAGRTARAGRAGRLVIFERAKGRGSEYGRVVRRSLAALGRTRQRVGGAE